MAKNKYVCHMIPTELLTQNKWLYFAHYAQLTVALPMQYGGVEVRVHTHKMRSQG